MAKEYQSILLEDLRIRWPGFVIRRVALNQHMPRVERLGEHLHRFSQLLVYLRGAGVQHLGGREVRVGRGTVLVVPAGVSHRFEKTRSLRPVCLVLDFEVESLPPWRPFATLGARDLALVERWLLALRELQGGREVSSVQVAAVILRLLARLEAALSVERPVSRGPHAAAVEAAVRRMGWSEVRPGRVAGALGRSLDHLNRQLQAERGVTVGGFLQEMRLARAQELLRETDIGIGAVGDAIGMPDQNYFARWFRKKTGQSPTRWRVAMRPS